MDVKVDINDNGSQVYLTTNSNFKPIPNPQAEFSFRTNTSYNENKEDKFQPVQYIHNSEIPLSTFPSSPLDFPSLRSNSRDKLSLVRLGLSIIPRLRSTHRFLLFWVVLHLGLGFLALSLSLFVKSLGKIVRFFSLFSFTVNSEIKNIYFTRQFLSWKYTLQISLFTKKFMQRVYFIFLFIYSKNQLALSGFGYIVIFDAFGLFNILISETISSYSDVSDPSSAYPFGLKRFEVVFGFVNILYVLFAATNLIKEGVESLLLGEVAAQVETIQPFDGFGPLSGAVVFLCCLMTFITAVSYRNHWQLSLLRFRKKSSRPVVYALGSQILNPFVLSTLVFGGLTISLLFNATFGLTQEVLDSIISLFQAGIIFYLTVPLALSFAMILLQNTPSELEEPITQAMNEICSLPYVDRCENLHVWQTTCGEYIGSLQVVLKSSESSFNYQSILHSVQAPWKKILHHCTVQVVNEP